MFDTHAHLNFSRFKKTLHETIEEAYTAGVNSIVMPGTDLKSSQRALEIAGRYDSQAQNSAIELFVAVGIHPHHVYELMDSTPATAVAEIEALLPNKQIVAIGEIGLDRHEYQETKYQDYHVDERFMDTQKELFMLQLTLALTHKKSVILHNREAKQDMLPLLEAHWDDFYRNRMVLHCCEADEELLNFALSHDIFIGVDGDLTFDSAKQEFIAKVPLERLVVETDSPFILPEPQKSARKYPNTPANLVYIVGKVAEIKGKSKEEIALITTQNAKVLFQLG